MVRRSRYTLVALLVALGIGVSPVRGEETVQARLQHPGIETEAVPLSAASESFQRMADAWEAEVIELHLGEQRITATRRELGAQVDRQRLERWLQDLGHADSPLREHHEGLRFDVPLAWTFQSDAILERLIALKADQDHRAEAARIDPETGEIIDEVHGLQVDPWATIDALDAAFRSGDTQVAIAAERQTPSRLAADLEGLDLRASLGTFETPYDGSGRSADRTHNLRVAAEKIDGMILMPGEVFDFNDIVGERSLAGGFRPATVIAGGELVDGVGGGACQIAGTLHAAVFFAGLEVVDRNPHSRPSSYIKLGLDAAVSYPNLNFRFRNDKDFPVQVRIVVEGGFTRAEILGAEARERVSFVRRIDDFEAFGEREIEDPNLPAGVRVLTQRGVPGFSVTRFRVIRDPELHTARRERSEDTYPPTTQVWRVGTGEPAPEDYEPPAGDRHNEYRADAYMAVTQGVGVEGTQIVRRAGRTGTLGWTTREGMPPAHRESPPEQ